jgi:hypothetical protein
MINKIGIETLIAVVMGIILFALGATLGSRHVQSKWDHEKLVQSQAINQAVGNRLQENANLAAEQGAAKELNRKEIKDENAAIDAVTHDSARLRIPASACPGPTPATKTASASGGVHIPAGAWPLLEVPAANPIGESSIELPTDIDAALKNKAEFSDRIVASCRGLQKFVRDNGMAP